MSTPILIQFFVGDERIAQVIVEVAMMTATTAAFLSARHAAGKPMGCAIAERVR
jgi:hypothetical protein